MAEALTRLQFSKHHSSLPNDDLEITDLKRQTISLSLQGVATVELAKNFTLPLVRKWDHSESTRKKEIPSFSGSAALAEMVIMAPLIETLAGTTSEKELGLRSLERSTVRFSKDCSRVISKAPLGEFDWRRSLKNPLQLPLLLRQKRYTPLRSELQNCRSDFR